MPTPIFDVVTHSSCLLGCSDASWHWLAGESPVGGAYPVAPVVMPSAIMRCWPCSSVVAFADPSWSAWSWVEIQMRQGHWAAVDLIGKGGHIRTAPIPNWVKAALDQWTRAAGVCEGKIFRAVAGRGKVWGSGLSQNVVWYVVRTCCARAGLEHIASHDLRRYAESRIMPNRV
jgi:hypothetical protein